MRINPHRDTFFNLINFKTASKTQKSKNREQSKTKQHKNTEEQSPKTQSAPQKQHQTQIQRVYRRLPKTRQQHSSKKQTKPENPSDQKKLRLQNRLETPPIKKRKRLVNGRLSPPEIIYFPWYHDTNHNTLSPQKRRRGMEQMVCPPGKPQRIKSPN